MATSISVSLRDGGAIKALDTLAEKTPLMVARALNQTTRSSKAESSRRIRRKIRLSRADVSGKDGKLRITQKANPSNLTARIQVDGRPRSLARFVTRTLPNGGGVVVSITPSTSKVVRKAFLINLKGKGGSTAPQHANVALAYRLKPGEIIRNRHIDYKLWGNVAILRTVSAQQVALNNKGKGVFETLSIKYIPATFGQDFFDQVRREGITV